VGSNRADDLGGLNVLLVIVMKGRLGDTFARSFTCLDTRNKKKFKKTVHMMDAGGPYAVPPYWVESWGQWEFVRRVSWGHVEPQNFFHLTHDPRVRKAVRSVGGRKKLQWGTSEAVLVTFARGAEI